MAYPYTGTSLNGGVNAGLSTQIIIEVDNQPVGAVQSLRTTQTRALAKIKEIGTDGIIEIVPQSATEFSISVDRMVFDRKTLPEAFSRAFLNIHAQRIPFDIKIYDFSSAIADPPDPTSATFDPTATFDAATNSQGLVTTVYENCWFASLGTTFSADNYVITQTAEIQCEFAISFANGSHNVPAGKGIPLVLDNLEKIADIGRRGSLDARGLDKVNELFAGANTVTSPSSPLT